jgi:DNA invertase Pin-like site-specific DNA recombinase
VFEEVASGAKSDRKQFNALYEWLKEQHDPSQFVVVIRDYARWARDTLTALSRLDELTAIGVSLIIVDTNAVLGDSGDPTAKFVFTLLSAVTSYSKEAEAAATIEATEEAAERGLFDGRDLELYPKRKRNPYRDLLNLLPAYEAGTMPMSGKDSVLTNLNARITQREPEMTRNWLKRAIPRLQEKQAFGRKVLSEWLDVSDAMRDAMKRQGFGNITGKKRTLRANALSRVTKAFMREPDQWPNPLTEGNPEIGNGPGTISDAIENFKRYQPRQR